MTNLPPVIYPKQHQLVAIILACLSVLSIATMLHHPSVSSHEIRAQMEEISRESAINALVHGGLIAITLLTNICLTVYAQMRNTQRLCILVGIAAFWLGSMGMVVAALYSGIIGPQLAEAMLVFNDQQAQQFAALFKLSRVSNQAFANFGTLCWCVGMFSWAFDMSKRGPWVALFGMASASTGVLVVIALISGWLSLTVSGMTVVLIAICLWQVGIAWLLCGKR